ncbi:MAG: ABC transporter permease [Planctomycetes bacterium]|nr:ABC transporter permease [Planctomycetota bacterium]
MKLKEVGSYAIHQLRQRPLRTALTTCGVAVGVTALVVLVSLASGVEHFLVKQFSANELVTRVTVYQRGGGRSLMGDPDEKPGPAITDEAIEQLAALPGATVSFPVVMPFLLAESKERLEHVPAFGLPLKAISGTYHEAIQAGKYWERNDAGAVCVLPSTLLPQLGIPTPQEAIGMEIAVTSFRSAGKYEVRRIEVPDGEGGTKRESRFKRGEDVDVQTMQVVGVYDSEAFGFEGMFMHVPLAEAITLQTKYGLPNRQKEGEYERAIVKAASPQPEAIEALKAEVERRGYGAQTVYDILTPLKWVFFFIKGLLAVFGGIGLLVAFFGIANTMLMAVLERTREIGVLKALGARNRDVRRIFLCEAFAIGFLGGVIGLGFGWIAGVIVDKILSSMADREISVFLVSPILAASVIGIAMLVAGIAGLYPAWRAARLIPVEALRRD